MKRVLFIQGAGAGVHAKWDIKLVESLRQGLGEEHEVLYPRMPNESDPKYDSWQPAIDKAMGALRTPAALVGHSVGGTILINTLGERPPRFALAAIVLIAAPFVGPGGWESEELPTPSDLAARLPPDVPVLLYHGDQDATVPIAHLELYARALPQAQVHRLAGRDHQLNNDLTQVANDLRALLTARP